MELNQDNEQDEMKQKKTTKPNVKVLLQQAEYAFNIKSTKSVANFENRRLKFVNPSHSKSICYSSSQSTPFQRMSMLDADTDEFKQYQQCSQLQQENKEELKSSIAHNSAGGQLSISDIQKINQYQDQLNDLSKKMRAVILTNQQLSEYDIYHYNQQNYSQFMQTLLLQKIKDKLIDDFPFNNLNIHEIELFQGIEELTSFYVLNTQFECQQYINLLNEIIDHQIEFKNPTLEEFYLFMDVEKMFLNILVEIFGSMDIKADQITETIQTQHKSHFQLLQQLIKLFDDVRLQFNLNLLDVQLIKARLEKIINQVLNFSIEQENKLIKLYNEKSKLQTKRGDVEADIVMQYIEQERQYQEEVKQLNKIDEINNLVKTYRQRTPYDMDFNKLVE